jgi:Glycosyltransferase family 87
MAARSRALLWVVVGVGLLLRLVLVFAVKGDSFDLGSMDLVWRALHVHALHLYALADSGLAPRWPYPPGFLPAILIAHWLGAHAGVSIHALYRLPAAVADCALALVVAQLLGRAGASDRKRVAAAALISLGPVPILASSYQAQIDSLAILPAVVAAGVWMYGPQRRRALLCGLLIGLGATFKTVPLIMVLALLPTARSRREAAMLVGAALALPLVVLAPFVIADASVTERALRYHGGPGIGGISLLLQPNLVLAWFRTGIFRFSSLTRHGQSVAGTLIVLSLAIVAAYCLRKRAAAPVAATLLWLAVYVFGVDFFFQYLVWGIPFFLLAGHLRAVAAVQLALLFPLAVRYLPSLLSAGSASSGYIHYGYWSAEVLRYVYVPVMVGVWAAAVAALVVAAREVATGSPEVGPVGGRLAV